MNLNLHKKTLSNVIQAAEFTWKLKKLLKKAYNKSIYKILHLFNKYLKVLTFSFVFVFSCD